MVCKIMSLSRNCLLRSSAVHLCLPGFSLIFLKKAWTSVLAMLISSVSHLGGFSESRCVIIWEFLGPVVIAASKNMIASVSLIADIACDTAGFIQIMCDCIKTVMYGMHDWQKM